ncbi:hypothetical protein BV898_13438 [Hypsibius exemplaris]|uniref:Uncharacterized protein n=1 Tax=Hypsibius exemplaris TaxID=2072580 RepID=A0A1W0WAU3_HYPEX|nr:hypothetical protein BV898_13438 [Hypsibius exemplaris]
MIWSHHAESLTAAPQAASFAEPCPPPVQSLPLRSLFGENAAIIGKSIAGTLLFIPFWLVFGLCIAVGNTIGSIRAMLGSSRIPQVPW